MDCGRLPGTPSSTGSGCRLLLSPVRQPLVVAAVAAGHLALPLQQHEPLVLPGRYRTVSTPVSIMIDVDQCCGSGSGPERIRTFLQDSDPDPNNWFGSRSGAERFRMKILCNKP